MADGYNRPLMFHWYPENRFSAPELGQGLRSWYPRNNPSALELGQGLRSNIGSVAGAVGAGLARVAEPVRDFTYGLAGLDPSRTQAPAVLPKLSSLPGLGVPDDSASAPPGVPNPGNPGSFGVPLDIAMHLAKFAPTAQDPKKLATMDLYNMFKNANAGIAELAKANKGGMTDPQKAEMYRNVGLMVHLLSGREPLPYVPQ